MRILVTADLHFDLWFSSGVDPLAGMKPIFDTLDALIIAGDLANDPDRNWPRALERIGRVIAPERVFILPGNHDYYHWSLDGDDRLQALVEDAGMHWAQKSVLQFGPVRFLCCTLWTDFRLAGDLPRAMVTAAVRMNDYRLIRSGTRTARPEDTAALHQDHLAWLTDTIALPFEGRTAIVTHHCPSPCATGAIDELTPSFTSNLDEWIVRYAPDLWMFGHTHRHLEGRVGRTPVVNVSLGYRNEVPPGHEEDILLRGLIDTSLPGFFVNKRKEST